MSFITVSNDVTVFRVQIKDIRIDIDSPNPNFSNFEITGNFDNFRTFSSTTSDKNPIEPSWSDFNMMFLYHTEMPEMLVVKRFTMSISCRDKSKSDGSKDHFIGESTIDLLTLAAGPTDVTLKLLNGSSKTGRIYAYIEMREVTEMEAKTTNFKLWSVPHPSHQLQDITVTVYKIGRDYEELVANGKVKIENGKKYLDLEISHHLFALTFPQMAETGGFSIELSKKKFIGKDIIGTVTILFTNQNLKRDETGRFATFHFKKNITCGGTVIGVIEGDCKLSHIPVFSQMYSGRTVDGVVCYGIPYETATIMPPFMSDEHRAEQATRV
eukprot:Tbor_TRINITY_DN1188_c0_g1::TRINITY_DN1188_c0_g1_i1::g.15582::m.15582